MKYLIGILLLVCFSAAAQEKLVKTDVTDNISMSLPEGFMVMTDDDMASKFITHKKPMTAYTTYERDIEFSVNKSNTKWTVEDMHIMQSFYKSSISQLYDEVNFIREGIYEINGRKFVYFEFASKVAGDKNSISKKSAVSKYSYIQYTIIDKKTILFNFSCPFWSKDNWKNTVTEMMQTVKIK